MSKIDKKWFEDAKWGMENETELFDKYREKWIAIHNKKVIMAGYNLRRVKDRAKKITGKPDLPVLYLEDPMRFFHV